MKRKPAIRRVFYGQPQTTALAAGKALPVPWDRLIKGMSCGWPLLLLYLAGFRLPINHSLHSIALSLFIGSSPMTWIFFTFLAAFMQSWRNAFQSHLSGDVKTAGVTLARFLWASPIAALYLLGLYQYQPEAALPIFNLSFTSFVVGASVMQIIATALMVKLFKFNNYAVGAGLAKSEALVAAILGMIFFGTHLSLLGWSGVVIGGVGVFMMSTQGGWRQLSVPTVLLGLGSGSAFALTSLWIREASLALGLPFPYSAAWVLLSVISLQTLMLVAYLLVSDPATLKALWLRPKIVVATSVCSCIGSLGWFSAMSLEAVPYVKTLGQVEIFFTMLISVFWLRQKVRIKDGLGLILVALAAVLVMWT